jgi:nitroreductase
MDTFEAIFSRRSVGRLAEPAPSPDELRQILAAAAAAPDHGSLRPFRFYVLSGPAKDAFGTVLADAYMARCQARGVEPHPAKADKERTKLGRAPVVVVVGAVRADNDKIPWEEQEHAAVAAAQNALLAATALGYGSMWRTGDPCYDESVKAALGLRPEDGLVGFLYLGTPVSRAAAESRVPDLDGLVTEWTP